MMQALKRVGVTLCVFTAAVAGSGCATGFIESPATDVTAASATLNGSVTSNRSEPGVYWFEYGTSLAYGTTTAQRPITFTSNVKRAVSEPISGLVAGTEYHYRLCAKDNDPKANCSKDATFTTSGTRPDRPRYLLHIDAGDGSSTDPQSGVADVTISVDGEQVDSSQPGCTTQNCSLAHDWALDADDYAPGRHTVTVRATDAVGRTSSRELEIDIQRDTTKPDLTVSGPLKTAPEGWVDQRTYTVTAAATDPGYGVTSLKLLIDDQQVGQPATQPCSDGGCPLNKTFTVNTANYGGGAHNVKLVATDGAGNATTNSWTMNVNPDGNVSAAEATATLEAADSTSAPPVIAPNSEVIDGAEIAAGINPRLEQTGSSLESTGTGATSTMTTSPAAGFTIHTPNDPIQVTPTQVSPSATTTAVANSVAAVSGNTSNQVDAVVRPIFDGVMTFQSVRDETSPEAFSWRVLLDTGQTLKSVDSQTAQVYYEDGTPAMMISVQLAHDATGASVPTTLSVTGSNVITLAVAHRGRGLVYPVAAGSGWQAPYILPNNNLSGGESSETWVGAPVLRRDEADPVERTRPVHSRPFKHKFCTSISGCTLSVAHHSLSGEYFYSGKFGAPGAGHAWWNRNRQNPSYISCADYGGIGYDWDINCDGFVGPNFQRYGGGYHITARARDYRKTTAAVPLPPLDYKPIAAYMYGSGNVTYHRTDQLCNPLSVCN